MSEVFVGRQPIFDAALEVQAYELLYRAGEHGHAGGGAVGDAATAQVIVNSLLEIGLDTLVGKHVAFINMTRAFLTGEQPIPIPPERAVLEVLEDISIDADLVARVRELAERGYRIALDDFVLHPEALPLVEMADYVKLDVMSLNAEELSRHVDTLSRYRPVLLAEKIETHAEFEACKSMGFTLFQGYFFARPRVLGRRQIPGNRLATLQLIAQMQDPDVDLDILQTGIAQHVSLSYKLLRYVNSAYLSMNREISSLRDAVMILGINTVRDLATLIALSEIDGKPSELMRTALTRARMCQRLAEAEREDRAMFFTVGLLSILDALLDTPMETVVAELPLSPAVKQALLRGAGSAGAALSAALHYERGQFDDLAMPGASESLLAQAYRDAVGYADANLAQLQALSR
jgi:EAL and modified HD-GYP domain-containing signal transduction protein